MCHRTPKAFAHVAYRVRLRRTNLAREPRSLCSGPTRPGSCRLLATHLASAQRQLYAGPSQAVALGCGARTSARQSGQPAEHVGRTSTAALLANLAFEGWVVLLSTVAQSGDELRRFSIIPEPARALWFGRAGRSDLLHLGQRTLACRRGHRHPHADVSGDDGHASLRLSLMVDAWRSAAFELARPGVATDVTERETHSSLIIFGASIMCGAAFHLGTPSQGMASMAFFPAALVSAPAGSAPCALCGCGVGLLCHSCVVHFPPFIQQWRARGAAAPVRGRVHHVGRIPETTTRIDTHGAHDLRSPLTSDPYDFTHT